MREGGKSVALLVFKNELISFSVSIQKILRPSVLVCRHHLTSRCVICIQCNAQESSRAIKLFCSARENVMGLANTRFLCWPVEYTFLSEVILLGVKYYCAVFCITIAPQKKNGRFLLCKVIYKHRAGDISHLSFHIYLQVSVVEIKLT